MKYKSILDRRENKPIYNKSNGLCKACGKNPMRESGLSEIPAWCPLPDMPKKEGG